LASDGSGAQLPRILAFDTSAAHCAAALLEGETVLLQRIEPMARGQAERLMPMLEECLGEAGLAWRDLDALAVCTGPGNFTGLRLSIAAARGLSLATGLRALGISAFEALAACHEGHVLALVRNPRGAPFAQVFRDGRALGPVGEADALPDLPADTVCVGFDATDVALRAGLGQFHELRTLEPGWIGAAALARLGEPPARPVPLYLRPADAAPAAPAPALLDDA
jgi:tRNA threonylcarbamoyladenosine biosynthesis protein TsaB